MRIQLVGMALTAMTCSAATLAADANAGKRFFREQCSLCHSAELHDGGGAQGPSLNGVFGRRAAGSSAFTYTKSLTGSSLVWDAATLDRFLTSPTSVVPGTAMVVAVPGKEDRDNLIAYFQAVKQGRFKETAPAPPAITPEDVMGFLAPFGCHPSRAEVGKQLKFIKPDGSNLMDVLGCHPPERKEGAADWKQDTPGRAHRIDLAHLPPPFATPAASNSPKVIAKPAGAQLLVPPGFHVQVFAGSAQVQAPRAMRVAPNEDVFVSETQNGRVKVLRPSADGSKAATVAVFAQGLSLPFGLAFYPNGADPKWLYVAETNRVVRYAYQRGDRKARGVPEIVVAQLSPVGGGGHTTRDVAFSADGKRMFVSVGSMSNVAEDIPKKSPRDIQTWEAAHGLGAAWGNEANRADVLVFEVGSNKPGKTFATGIRNCVGLTIEPHTGDLWCTTNERDLLGDDLVPDYSTRVKEGGFYGWPWYYFGNHEDPRLKGDRPDLAGKAIVPDVPYQAHSAALNLVFYPVVSGRSAFPQEYVGDGFAVLHGSWNHALRTGHKVVRVRMKNGVPTGEYDDFMVGFIVDKHSVWGRPVGAAVAGDGSLLISDDSANAIYRISYGR